MIIYGVYRYGGQWEDSWNMINKEMYSNPKDAEKWLLDNGYKKRTDTFYDIQWGMFDEWEGARIKEFELNTD